MPAPGTISRFRAPLGPGVRASTRSSKTAPRSLPFYDSMIAKLVVWDTGREAAISRAERVLGELVVDGVPTTRELALAILASEDFRSGVYSTSTLGELGMVAA
jgi:acetyl-CoA carboxylase biotin carboxylase subunit